VYGVGLKSDINRHLAVRLDLRGVYGEQPHFGITANPGPVGSIFVAGHGSSSGLEFTSSIVFRFGLHEPPPVVVAAPPPPPAPRPVAHPTISAITGAHDVCPGDDLRLSVSSSGWLPDTTPSYQWYVNNTAASGGTGTSFSVPTGGGAGSRAVKVTASVGDASVTSGTVNVNIKNDAPPTIQFSVSPTTIAYGDKLPLAARATGSECGNPVTVRYSASEGSISGTTFDSSGVSMDMNNRLNQQSKAVRLTATVTDAKNRTASAPATVNVTLTPQAKRLDDIVFQSNSARVNNCGKRLLLEELTPMLRNDPNAKVILIGHRDNGERVALKLDENRTLNAAAILSAGKGICPSLDLSRILVHYAGTDQSSDTRPALCGSSTTERSGQAVRDSDKRAQFRRVEVWIVPGGADMPAGTSGYTAAPDRETKAKACPR
jgi:outer membrane protein OmpA-like peptidoglycan-associated protein